MNGSDIDSRALLALQRSEKISLKKKEYLFGAVECPSELFSPSCAKLLDTVLGEVVDEVRGFYRESDDFLETLSRKNISYVTRLDDEYPQLLAETEFAPLVLFAKGRISLLGTDSIAIVGTRKPTRYGLKLADEFARELGRAGFTIVSGFARGIDSAAHKACAECGYPTVAVFGCGVDVCYPAENRALYDAILASGGLIVSEYAPGVRPAQYRFPDRNRIISGLSKGVFLPEAAKKSGSLITLNLALEQNRDVFIAPGNVFSPESEGCNHLLKSMPHALTLSPEDILDHYRISYVSKEKEPVQLGIAETAVAEALHDGEKHFEELLAATEMSAAELSTLLVNLELAGVVEHTGGNYYSLC